MKLVRRLFGSPHIVWKDDALSDLWEHREGLREAIKEILAGGNIPTHVATLIYLAGPRAAASRRASPPAPPSVSAMPQ